MSKKFIAMSLLGEAINKNVCKPRPAELGAFTHDRWHRASPTLEGDSQIGTLLYIGVGTDLGFSKEEILDFLSIEREEFEYKLRKYEGSLSLSDGGRLGVKVRLIKNFILLR